MSQTGEEIMQQKTKPLAAVRFRHEIQPQRGAQEAGPLCSWGMALAATWTLTRPCTRRWAWPVLSKATDSLPFLSTAPSDLDALLQLALANRMLME